MASVSNDGFTSTFRNLTAYSYLASVWQFYGPSENQFLVLSVCLSVSCHISNVLGAWARQEVHLWPDSLLPGGHPSCPGLFFSRHSSASVCGFGFTLESSTQKTRRPGLGTAFLGGGAGPQSLGGHWSSAVAEAPPACFFLLSFSALGPDAPWGATSGAHRLSRVAPGTDSFAVRAPSSGSRAPVGPSLLTLRRARAAAHGARKHHPVENWTLCLTV